MSRYRTTLSAIANARHPQGFSHGADIRVKTEEVEMISYKHDIRCADFESAIKKAIIEVDNMIYATSSAKKEVYDILMRMRDNLIKWDNEEIEIPYFMRETR